MPDPRRRYCFECGRWNDRFGGPDAHSGGCPQTGQPYPGVVDDIVAAAEREVLDLISDGVVPASVRTYSELHDYVDANMLASYDELTDALGVPGSTDILNEVEDRVDDWMATGRLHARPGIEERATALANYLREHYPSLHTLRHTDRVGVGVTDGDTLREAIPQPDGTWSDHSASAVIVHPNGQPARSIPEVAWILVRPFDRHYVAIPDPEVQA